MRFPREDAIAHASDEEHRNRRSGFSNAQPVAGHPRPRSSPWQSLVREIGAIEDLNSDVARNRLPPGGLRIGES